MPENKINSESAQVGQTKQNSSARGGNLKRNRIQLPGICLALKKKINLSVFGSIYWGNKQTCFSSHSLDCRGSWGGFSPACSILAAWLPPARMGGWHLTSPCRDEAGRCLPRAAEQQRWGGSGRRESGAGAGAEERAGVGAEERAGDGARRGRSRRPWRRVCLADLRVVVLPQVRHLLHRAGLGEPPAPPAGRGGQQRAQRRQRRGRGRGLEPPERLRWAAPRRPSGSRSARGMAELLLSLFRNC